jgi:hypothetical protein
MKLEIAIYLLVAAILFSITRIFNGMKNGSFYAKGNKPMNEKIKPYVENLHRIEAPLWYTLFGSLFLLSLAIFRALDYNVTVWQFLIHFLAAYLVTMGSSAVSSYWYQGWINIGSNLEWVDKNENPKAEFAFHFMGKNYSFWWKRPWKGKIRLYSSILGTVVILIGIYLGIFYKL